MPTYGWFYLPILKWNVENIPTLSKSKIRLSGTSLKLVFQSSWIEFPIYHDYIHRPLALPGDQRVTANIDINATDYFHTFLRASMYDALDCRIMYRTLKQLKRAFLNYMKLPPHSHCYIALDAHPSWTNIPTDVGLDLCHRTMSIK
jgi:hypothetical protein